MKNPLVKKLSSRGRLMIVAGAVWTFAVAGSLVWNWHSIGKALRTLAESEADSSLQKDLVYRRWASQQGGVYVLPTDATPPNPYLAHLPDRDVTTTDGKVLTLVNPAYMARQVHELGQKQYGLRAKITSLNPLRPENTPDAWEAKTLLAFEAGATEMIATEMLDGQPFLRLMRPFVTEKDCLKCHTAQGYREGDIRGGISVSVPLAPYRTAAAQRRWLLTLAHGVIGVLGLGGLWIGNTRLRKQQRELESQNEEIHRSEARFRMLVEGSPDAIFVHIEHRFAFVNEAAVRLYGAGTAADLLGQPVLERVHPDSRETVQERIRQLTEQRLPVPRLELVHLRLDGTPIPVEVSAGPIHFQGIDGGLVFVRDITERKNAEAKQDEQLAELQRWHDVTLGREARVMELKTEVNELLAQSGQSPRYQSVLDKPDGSG